MWRRISADLERVPIRLNRKRALDSLLGRIFCGKPPKSAVADLGDIDCRSRVNPRSVSTFPENAPMPGLRMRPSLLNPLFAAITTLPGVGPKLEKLFGRLLGRDDKARIVD